MTSLVAQTNVRHGDLTLKLACFACFGCLRASDLAGNVAATSHFNWTVDTNVPDTVRTKKKSGFAGVPRGPRPRRNPRDAENKRGAIVAVKNPTTTQPGEFETLWSSSSCVSLKGKEG